MRSAEFRCQSVFNVYQRLGEWT